MHIHEVTQDAYVSGDSRFGTWARYGLDGRGNGVRVPAGANFSPLRIIQTGSGAHPDFYTIGTRD
jgi:hypothetical protein